MSDDVHDLAAAATDRFDLWCRIFREYGTSSLAEIGVWRGEYAAAVLRGCPGISTYYLVDPWRPLETWNKPFNVSREQFAEAHRTATAAVAFAESRVVELRGTTLEVADRIPDGSLDAVYVDGDHTLRGITIDLIRMLRKLRPGGLLGGDDFVANPWHHGLEYDATLVRPFAIHFAEAMGLPIMALPFDQFVMWNRPGSFSFTNLAGEAHRGREGTSARGWGRMAQAVTRRVRNLLTGRR